MSDEYKMRTLADFIDGRIAILCATEAAGMVSKRVGVVMLEKAKQKYT